MPCANCRKDLLKLGEDEDGALNEFIQLAPALESDGANQEAGKIQITIADSIGIIFEGNLKLRKKQISAACKLKMCPDCLTSLSDLHGSYVRFMGLAQEGSYVQQLIESSVLWPSFGADRGFDFHYDDFSPLAEVKLEERQESGQDDTGGVAVSVAIIKEEQEDPSFVYEGDDDGGGGGDDSLDCDFPFLRRSSRRSTVIKSRKSQVRRKKSTPTQVSSQTPRKSTKRKASGSPAPKKEPKIKKPKEVKVKSTVDTPADKPFKCPEENCIKSFRCGKLFRRHMKFKHGGAAPEELLTRTCHLCPTPKIFLIPSQLRSHQQEVHATETPFECPKCERRFPTKNRLRIHTLLKHTPKNTSQTQTEKEPLLCPHSCPTPFRSKVSLQLHLKSVHGEVTKHTCGSCGRSFPRHCRYLRHLKYKHGEGLTPSDLVGRECPLCSKVFETKSLLRGHTASVHTQERPFECDVEGCGKKFPTKNYLNIHRCMRHKKDPVRYPCEQCGKSYTSKPSLQEHIDITHLEKKNIICEVCGKAFARPNILVRHMETHDTTRERRHECPVCKQLFISERTLKSHAITHSGAKDQCCSHCGQTFLHVGSLRRHIHAKHGVNLATRGADAKKGHTCDQCGKTFKLREYLSQHLRSRTHGGKGHTAQRKREEPGEAMVKEGEDSMETPPKELVMGRGKARSGAGVGPSKFDPPPQHSLFWQHGSIPPSGSSHYFHH